MAKDLDKNGKRFETGQPVKVNGKSGKGYSATVMGGHEDGVSLVTDDGDRITLHASPSDASKLSATLDDKGVAIEPFVQVEITGDAPNEAGIAALHEKWVKQAEEKRLAASKG